MQQQVLKKRRILKRTPPSDVLEEIKKGNKFIVLENDIDNVPEGFTVVDMKYKGSSFKALVPQQVVFYLANPGEGSIDDALDEVADFYNDIEDFEDKEILNSRTSVQDANWATVSREAYKTYLINKLTRNGEDFDDKVLEDLCLDDKYVKQRVEAIAALCLEKSVDELEQSKLEDIIKHVTINWKVKEKVTKKELRRQRCWSGSHYEVRDVYKNVEKLETVTKSKEYAVLDKKVAELEKEIEEYRRKEGKKIDRHDSALIREYINISYIAKEDTKKQLDINLPSNPNKNYGEEDGSTTKETNN